MLPSSICSCSHRRFRVPACAQEIVLAASERFITKSRKAKPSTGTQILKGLELASPYTWRLAERDRFGEGGEMYQPGNVLCTVLVGNIGYRGISAIANEDGSDGTVRISTANMECVRIHAEFPANPDEAGHDVNYIIDPSSEKRRRRDGRPDPSSVKLFHRSSVPCGR